MDIPSLRIDDLQALALRLERLSDGIDELAVRTRHGTSRSWRGEAAERHRELVAEQSADLAVLALAMRDAAATVRVLAATAREHLAILEAAAEIARTPLPSPVLP